MYKAGLLMLQCRLDGENNTCSLNRNMCEGGLWLKMEEMVGKLHRIDVSMCTNLRKITFLNQEV